MTVVLALWLFVPVAIVIATCFLDAIASAVDRRFYPGLPVPARRADRSPSFGTAWRSGRGCWR